MIPVEVKEILAAKRQESPTKSKAVWRKTGENR
jgi:hypothetical protein